VAAVDPVPLPFDDLFSFMGPIFLVSLLLPLIMTGVVVGVVIWAIRRNAPRRESPAIEELKSRLARGEIDPVEYQVRIRALHDGDEV
jgi:putative membrane protein